MKKVFTLGEIVVEIMANQKGQLFTHDGLWKGPFASGAPAIFIDQVAKLDEPAAMISCVGNDGFGELNIKKLADDGVDISNIKVMDDQTTGSAFVTYHEDGSRDFIFNIKNAACALINEEMVSQKILQDCDHLHIMGSSLFSKQILDTAKKAIAIVKQNKGIISFDPNIRKEMLNLPGVKEALLAILQQTDIYLPSESEVTLLADTDNEKQAIDYFLNNGISSIVIKKGNKGASYYSANESFDVQPNLVTEIDPTGAGDCFGGAYVALIHKGFSAKKALTYANACGALAVTKQGPMQGTSTLEQIEKFLQK